METVTAGDAAQIFCTLLGRAREEGTSFLITRYGKPVAVLMPAGDHGNRFQAADPVVCSPGSGCPVCETYGGCSHATARCLICGEVGFARLMTVEDHGPHCRGVRR